MLLLDTHIWLWWINATPGKLPTHLIERIEGNEAVAISAISCFEVEWLARHGRIELDISLDDWFSCALTESGIVCLPITEGIARLAASLPEHHKDPQDRLIIPPPYFTMLQSQVLINNFPFTMKSIIYCSSLSR